jgi:hypothetical protein
VNAFSTLSISGNMDLEKFEDTVEAIYQANEGKLKSDDEDEHKVNLITVDDKKYKKKKNYKEKIDKYKESNDNKESVNIVEELAMIQTSVVCWIRIKEDVQNGLILRNIAGRKKRKSQLQQ